MLAAQLKSFSKPEDVQPVEKFAEICCRVLRETEKSDLTSCENDFVQGILGLYHLVRMIDNLDSTSLLSRTILHCLRQLDRSVKDAEAIAANCHNHLWSASRKIEGQHSQTYRSLSLQIFVHSGTANWSHTADRLVNATKEVSASSLRLSEKVFDEFSSYFNSQKCRGLTPALILLDTWTCLVLQSRLKSNHQDRISVMKKCLNDTVRWQQFSDLLIVILNMTGVESKKLDIDWESYGSEFGIILVRLVNLANHYGNMILSKPVEKNESNQIACIRQVLIAFYEKSQSASMIQLMENRMKMPTAKLKINCVSQALSMHFHLVKLDPCESNVDQCAALFDRADELSDSILILNQQDLLVDFFTRLGK